MKVMNRALILIGFAGAFRRSELCAVTVSDAAVKSRSGAGRRQSRDPFWRAQRYLPDQSAPQMSKKALSFAESIVTDA